jgi:hypothetical protein
MARWRKGEEQVASLIEQRHLQQVTADSQTAAGPPGIGWPSRRERPPDG